jgi:hypothetical protein
MFEERNIRGLLKVDVAELFMQAVPSPFPEAELTAQRWPRHSSGG